MKIVDDEWRRQPRTASLRRYPLSRYLSRLMSHSVSPSASNEVDEIAHGALASLDCEIESVAEIGTHTLFFCTVKARAYACRERRTDLARSVHAAHAESTA